MAPTRTAPEFRVLQRSLATAIRAEMAVKGWSRQRLAEESGITTETMMRIMLCQRDMTVTQLDKIIRALGVTDTYLFQQAAIRANAATTTRATGR